MNIKEWVKEDIGVQRGDVDRAIELTLAKVIRKIDEKIEKLRKIKMSAAYIFTIDTAIAMLEYLKKEIGEESE
ncbi:MAG: hypothetical protein DRN14_04095 [Thermoplasmata archaeon]|nr:MAG: hypothetical protein DRN14_04095 [Thermoplasmata archaeon]